VVDDRGSFPPSRIPRPASTLHNPHHGSNQFYEAENLSLCSSAKADHNDS